MMHSTAAKPRSQSFSKNDIAEVMHSSDNNQKSLHALKYFKTGDVVCEFGAKEVFPEANYLTLQIGTEKHISLTPEFLQYTNHSCNPNIFFDTSSMLVVALRNIDINDELCFFYPSTEWKMAQPFLCFCGSKGCLKNIDGAEGLSNDVLKKYKLTEYIHSMLAANNG